LSVPKTSHWQPFTNCPFNSQHTPTIRRSSSLRKPLKSVHLPLASR
jgi:hypothetical protein